MKSLSAVYDLERLKDLQGIPPTRRFDKYFAAENLRLTKNALHMNSRQDRMHTSKGPGPRIVTGFAVVIALTLLISGWSYYHISMLGQSSENLFLANYRSVQYALTMQHAIESLGFADSLTSELVEESTNNYWTASRLEHDNITEHGERELIEHIDQEFGLLEKQIHEGTPDVRGQSKRVLLLLQELIQLNEQAMFAKAAQIQSQASFARDSSLVITILLCSTAIFLAIAVSRRSLAEYRELDRAKSNFVATAAHELKTPLSTIKTTADMLLGGLGGQIPSTATPLLQRVQHESTRLISLVSELLDLTKLDTGQFTLDLSQHKASDILEAAAVQMAMVAQRAGTEIDVTVFPFDLTMSADANKLGHALTNLLSNAIKYADKGSHIEIKATEVDHEIWLTVSNKGKGIPEHMQQSIFDKFVQVEAGAMGIGRGSGLGLAIAKEIVTLHRGRIWVDSLPGGVTTFTIALPQKVSKSTIVTTV
jgi:signal transduction histidine kinase